MLFHRLLSLALLLSAGQPLLAAPGTKAGGDFMVRPRTTEALYAEEEVDVEFFLGDTRGSYSELNLTSGFISQVRDNFTLSFGVVAPLRGSDNRSFDYQIGLRANYFFGPTSRTRNEPTSVSSF